MRWAEVLSVEVDKPGAVRLRFAGCDHDEVRRVNEFISRVEKDPQSLVGKVYYCRACSPGEESGDE